jgi:hypothetical protein
MNIHTNNCDSCGNFTSVAMIPDFVNRGIRNVCRVCNRKDYELSAEIDKEAWLKSPRFGKALTSNK